MSNNKINWKLFLPFPLSLQQAPHFRLQSSCHTRQNPWSPFSGSQSSRGQDWSSTFRIQNCFSPLLSSVMHSLSEAVSLCSFLRSPPQSFLILSSHNPHWFLLSLGAGLRSSLPGGGPLLLKRSICWNLLRSFSTVSSCDPLATSLRDSDSLEYVGFLRFSFYSKTGSQQFPFRMETSPSSELSEF